MPIGQQLADARRVAVRVAVHSPPSPCDGSVYHLRVREVGPLGARQVDRRHLLERQRSLPSAALAQAAIPLLLVDVLELAVVVEEAHRLLARRELGARPGDEPGTENET